jgi:serine protease inhibitor
LPRGAKVLALVAICVVLGHCGDESGPSAPTTGRALPYQCRDWSLPTEAQIVRSNTGFGLYLFRRISEAVPDSNLVVSPLSVSMAVGMVLNGAAGETLEELKSVLGFSGLSLPAANRCYGNLMDDLCSLDPEVRFEIANSVWCREGIPFKRPFLDACDKYFDATAANLDFDRPDAARTINEWVAGITHDRINDIVNDPISPLTMVILVNAVYFKGPWSHPFDPLQTYDGSFRLSDGSTTTCRMMLKTHAEHFRTLETSSFTALDLPYGDGAFSMTIFLPAEGTSIQAMLEHFNPDSWDRWMGRFDSWYGDLFMPRFTVEYCIRLNEILIALGMVRAFDPLQADFANMCTAFDDFYLQKVKHKTYIRVDEYGTEAAAATEAEGGPTSVIPSFRVDRPFVYVIRDKHTGTILFMGQVMDPGYFMD